MRMQLRTILGPGLCAAIIGISWVLLLASTACGSPALTEQILDSFRNHEFGRNDLHGNVGLFNANYITLTAIADSAPNAYGPALRLQYDFTANASGYTGVWESLWGESEDNDHYLDFTQGYREIRFWVRGSGNSLHRHRVKVELKDIANDYSHTAYTYVSIGDNDTNWREIALDADVTNSTVWFYNGSVPDSKRMKQLVLVVEESQNSSTGSFDIDDIKFIINAPAAPGIGKPLMFDSFRNFSEGLNDLNGNAGPLIDNYVTLTQVGDSPTGGNVPALQLDYDLSEETALFTGLWESIWGNSDDPNRYFDFTKGVREIRFWVRGRGITDQTFNLKVELKDKDGDYLHTAFRYVLIDGSDTEWRQIILDADVTNATLWTYSGGPPDPRRMKQLVLVLERNLNPPTGTFFLDDIQFVIEEPTPASGLVYTFEDYDDRDEAFNDFNGNWGALIAGSIETSFDTNVHNETDGASLRMKYSFPTDEEGAGYTGIWQSLWSHIEDGRSLDFADIYGALNEPDKNFEQIHFWVRGSGDSNHVHNLKVELKDISGAYERTAYRYVSIDDGDTTWRQVVLDADIANGKFWSYNGEPPDRTRMKQMVFVLDRDLNRPAGTFFIDDIRFVDADDSPFDASQHSDDEFLHFVSKRTFLYFLDWYDPETGLFQDRSTFPDLISTASTGFGLTALVIGAERGWITGRQAKEMVLRTLQTLAAGQSQSTAVEEAIDGTNGYKGFYYHFLGEDGFRINSNSELSSVDTAILMAGVLCVREYFIEDPGVVALADLLYRRVEWPWMVVSELDPGHIPPRKDQFYLGWKPECDDSYAITAEGGGCFSGRWDTYTDEVILINLLAIGSPTHPVETNTFYSWYRGTGRHDYEDHRLELVSSWPGSLFTYFFAHLWIDFASVGTDKHPDFGQRVDWWNNTVKAALTSWQFSVDHADQQVHTPGDGAFTTYGSSSWGLTAAEGPPGVSRLMWDGDNSERRALLSPLPNGPRRKAAAGYAHTSFEIYIEVKDSAEKHCIAFYMLDWENLGRSQTITLVSLSTGKTIGQIEADAFRDGKYVGFPFQGSVKAIINRTGITDTVVNAVLSGIFFDPPMESSEECRSLDDATGGEWPGIYGRDGYVLMAWNGTRSDHAALPWYVNELRFRSGYHAYGAPPSGISGTAGFTPDHDGTVAPYGAGMAVMLKPRAGKLQEDVPQKAIAALRHYFSDTDLWHYRFGFGDAYNLDPPDFGSPWYNRTAFGIDQGPMLLAIENYRSGLVWNEMAKNPWLRHAGDAVFAQGYLPLVMK